MALSEANTLPGVFGRRGASILVRPVLCFGRPFGPAAAFGAGLPLMIVLFDVEQEDLEQPPTCFYDALSYRLVMNIHT